MYATKNLPVLPGIQEQYYKENGGEMFSTMVAVAEGLIDEVLEGVTQDTITCEFDTFSNEDDDSKRLVRSCREVRPWARGDTQSHGEGAAAKVCASFFLL